MTTYTSRVYSSFSGDRSIGASFPRGENVHQIDSGLYSVQGAQAIISAIRLRRAVKKLILGHNELGDPGCIALFQFLSSDIGRCHEINEIGLNSNHIGDNGLLAITTYLHGNNNLKELFLQNNEFTGDPSIARILANAVNASKLEILSLTSNHLMSDTFVAEFLPALTSTHLRELYLSTMNITPRSLPYLREYLSSNRCRLRVLQCNGNFLGLRAVLAIIRAVEQYNYSLTSLELHSNRLMDADEDSASDEELLGRNTDLWKDCHYSITQIIGRNEQLGRETQQQALMLLRYARTVFLRPQCKVAGLKRMSIQLPSSDPDEAHSRDNTSSFSFRKLPLEIQFYLLSFLSPILSRRQCANIYAYAATPTTLPPLLPRLVGSTTDWKQTYRGQKAYDGRINGQFAGQKHTVMTIVKEKHRWLSAVGCMVYEPCE